MDIQLPILDGYEATRRRKADAVLQAIPAIAVTSYGLAGDDGRARADGPSTAIFGSRRGGPAAT